MINQSPDPSTGSPYGRGLDEVFPDDPLQENPHRREIRDQRSTRQAFYYFFGVPVLVMLLAGIIMVISRMSGGPLCEAGEATWLCSRAAQIWFSLLPGVIAMGSVFLAVFITYYKWRSRQRWRWWMAVVWLSMPFALAWITGTGNLLMLGHI